MEKIRQELHDAHSKIDQLTNLMLESMAAKRKVSKGKPLSSSGPMAQKKGSDVGMQATVTIVGHGSDIGQKGRDGAVVDAASVNAAGDYGREFEHLSSNSKGYMTNKLATREEAEEGLQPAGEMHASESLQDTAADNTIGITVSDLATDDVEGSAQPLSCSDLHLNKILIDLPESALSTATPSEQAQRLIQGESIP